MFPKYDDIIRFIRTTICSAVRIGSVPKKLIFFFEVGICSKDVWYTVFFCKNNSSCVEKLFFPKWVFVIKKRKKAATTKEMMGSPEEEKKTNKR